MKQLVAAFAAVLVLALPASAGIPLSKPSPVRFIYCDVRPDGREGYLCVETTKMNGGRAKAIIYFSTLPNGRMFGVRWPIKR